MSRDLSVFQEAPVEIRGNMRDWHGRFREARDAKAPRTRGLLLRKIFEDICTIYMNYYKTVTIKICAEYMNEISERLDKIEERLKGAQ